MAYQCVKYANYRYTWPGRDESFICEDHCGKLRAVAGAMGLHLQLIPIVPSGDSVRPMCGQQVTKQNND